MKKVLVLQHVPYGGPGYIADYLTQHGIALDVVELWKPYALPELSRYSAVIILGGPMAAYEDFPARNDEVALIRAAVDTIPTLGICLGSELIAHALGARVYPNASKEMGYATVRLTAEGLAHPLFKGFAPDMRVFEWHGDAFDLPGGASLLATSPACRHQAFVYKNLSAFIFHWEMTPAMVEGLHDASREWAEGLDERKLRDDTREHAALMKAQCFRLLDNFFG